MIPGILTDGILTRQSGRLTQWNDERGFGFIATDNGGRVFVHVTAIARMVNRPRVGDVVEFETHLGRDGRLEARSARVVGANPLPRPNMRQKPGQGGFLSDWRFLLASILAALLVAAVLLGRIPYYLPLAYAAMGAVTVSLYRADKYFAETGQWRISEALLHGADLGFGIVGGLLGQAIFRHKTRKPAYVATTVLLGGVHLFWIAALTFGLIDYRDILALPALLSAG